MLIFIFLSVFFIFYFNSFLVCRINATLCVLIVMCIFQTFLHDLDYDDDDGGDIVTGYLTMTNHSAITS